MSQLCHVDFCRSLPLLRFKSNLKHQMRTPNLFSDSKNLQSEDMKSKDFKGAVCRILTLLKHKNTIICLQTFRKHVKLTYVFILKTMLQSVILLWKCAFRCCAEICTPARLCIPSLKSLPDCLIPTPPLILTPPPHLTLNLPILGGA